MYHYGDPIHVVWNENVDFQAKYKYMRVPTKHALNTHRSVMQIGENMNKDEKVDKVITNVIWRKRKKTVFIIILLE